MENHQLDEKLQRERSASIRSRVRSRSPLRTDDDSKDATIGRLSQIFQTLDRRRLDIRIRNKKMRKRVDQLTLENRQLIKDNEHFHKTIKQAYQERDNLVKQQMETEQECKDRFEEYTKHLDLLVETRKERELFEKKFKDMEKVFDAKKVNIEEIKKSNAEKTKLSQEMANDLEEKIKLLETKTEQERSETMDNHIAEKVDKEVQTDSVSKQSEGIQTEELSEDKTKEQVDLGPPEIEFKDKTNFQEMDECLNAENQANIPTNEPSSDFEDETKELKNTCPPVIGSNQNTNFQEMSECLNVEEQENFVIRMNEPSCDFEVTLLPLHRMWIKKPIAFSDCPSKQWVPLCRKWLNNQVEDWKWMVMDNAAPDFPYLEWIPIDTSWLNPELKAKFTNDVRWMVPLHPKWREEIFTDSKESLILVLIHPDWLKEPLPDIPSENLIPVHPLWYSWVKKGLRMQTTKCIVQEHAQTEVCIEITRDEEKKKCIMDQTVIRYVGDQLVKMLHSTSSCMFCSTKRSIRLLFRFVVLCGHKVSQNFKQCTRHRFMENICRAVNFPS